MRSTANDHMLEEVKRIFSAYLEKHRLRKTSERYAILEEIYRLDKHFDAESLYQSLREAGHSLSRATVYNTLDLLLQCDLVSKHQFDSSQAQYEKAYGFRQHDHLICLDCNRVLEFCDPRLQEIESTIGNLLNFKIQHHSLTLYGTCRTADCEHKN